MEIKLARYIKKIIWCALRNALPSKARLCEKLVDVCETCNVCGLGIETMMHCLRDCTYARLIWLLLGLRLVNFFWSSVFGLV